MARFPAVGYNYVAYLSQRIWFLNEKIDALAAGSAEGKLAQYLLTHSREGWMEWDWLGDRPGQTAGCEPGLPLSRAGCPDRLGRHPAGGGGHPPAG